MPQHGLEQISGTTVMQKLCMAADFLRQTNPPQGRCAPLATTGCELGPVVGQPFAHVVKQQVAVGVNDLIGQFRLGGVVCGGECWGMARHTAGFVEQVLPGQHLRRTDIAPRRHGEVAGIELDEPAKLETYKQEQSDKQVL